MTVAIASEFLSGKRSNKSEIPRCSLSFNLQVSFLVGIPYHYDSKIEKKPSIIKFDNLPLFTFCMTEKCLNVISIFFIFMFDIYEYLALHRYWVSFRGIFSDIHWDVHSWPTKHSPAWPKWRRISKKCLFLINFYPSK